MLSEDIEKCKTALLQERKPHLIALCKEIYGDTGGVEIKDVTTVEEDK